MIIGIAGSDSSRRTLWRGKCDCGKEKTFRGDNLSEKTKSCGCLHTPDLSGQRFGRLVVLDKHRTHRRKTHTVKQWMCKCDCSKVVWVNSQDLKTQHTKSCGCLQRETNRNRLLEFGLASKRKCYGNYKKAAKKKFRKFKLTFQEFIDITSKKCSYCGAHPSNVVKNKNGEFVYNGIDRVDSSLGYISDNCVPCCRTCNIAKHTMTREVFLRWLQRAHLYSNGSNSPEAKYSQCIVVAEAGCNHMGNFNIALQLIEMAKLCKADYVKFQKRTPELCVPKHIQSNPHQNPNNAFGSNYLEHRNNLEFTIEQHQELKLYCDKIGIKYACSVWDIVSAKEIATLSPDYIKIPSAMNNNFKLIEYVFQNQDNDVHISLGMATKREIEGLIDFVQPYFDRVIFYWTTSGYPVDFKELFLTEINKLRDRGFRVGFSGHHRGIAVDIAAYTLGATHIERHFTLDRCWKGTDHAASLEPSGLDRLCRDLRATYESFARKHQITEDEKINRSKLR